MHALPRTAVSTICPVLAYVLVMVLSPNLINAAEQSTAAPFLSSDSRKVYNLAGTWQRIEDGVAVDAASVPGDLGGGDPVRLRKTLRIDSLTLASNSWHLQLFGLVDGVELLVNGRFVMRYPGGMVPFGIRIRDGVLRPGQNTIELLITPTSSMAANVQRMGRSAAKLSFGVIREIFLVGTPHLWTESVRLRTSIQGSVGTVAVSARVMSGLIERIRSVSSASDGLSNSTIPFAIEMRVVERASGLIVSTSSATSSIGRSRETVPSMTLSVGNVRLWSPSNPNLYDLQVKLSVDGRIVDSYAISFGFRSIRVATFDGARKVVINDTAVRINAVDYVEDAPGVGPTLSLKQMQYDVSLMKTLGINAIRVIRGSPHPELLALCDTYGILVFAELPCADVPASMLDEQELSTRFRNVAERSVAYLDSHPSVVAIGLSDGLDEKSSSVSRYHLQMGQFVRRSSSKLVYKVVSSRQLDETSEGGFDIIIARFFATADSAQLFRLQPRSQSAFTSVAVIAEFGGLVSPSNTNGFSDPLSNEAQALLINKFFSWSNAAQLAGVLVWTFNDFHLERPTMLADHYDPYICTSGLVDTYRQRRVAFEMYKALINDEKLPLLQARESGFSTPIIFIAAGILLGITLALLANRSRRFREYVVRALLRPYNFYADIRDQRILSTAHTGVLALVISGSAGLVIASFLYFVRVDPWIEQILHVLVSSNTIYEAVRFIAWNPELSTLVWSLLILAILSLISLVLRSGAAFVRGRITISDTFTIVVWSSLPVLVLLPIGIALHQALTANELSVFVPITILAISLWVVLRILRATSVVFDARPLVVYSIGIGFIMVLIAIAVVSLDVTHHGFSFLSFFVNAAT